MRAVSLWNDLPWFYDVFQAEKEVTSLRSICFVYHLLIILDD
jgi:hypothetical protein